ncbi:hypothetical protein HU200_015413 [Digitaria exilis]|uniref:Peroxidase n=1 Tax=Digitaria exilis TaxID=1010633 RepID=A0A835FAQ0_9POAL|nr:hypothetical protein HU200_015413 [Digitaria exilis]CAB3469695.1 unnamed protein product [Digitaria exilis]
MASGSGGVVLLLGSMLVAASAMPLPLETMMPNDDESMDLHALPCPDLHSIVGGAVWNARAKSAQITAGLLRIFFHDCFPQGCDASILLDGANSERKMPQNQGLQQSALDLVESIRDAVHRRCGATVSCADILAVATAHAVNQAGGPVIPIALGRRDSLEPAPGWAVSTLPRPDADVTTLINAFSSKGLGGVDLVALSGAHTVGKARCSAFADRTRSPNDAFTTRLAQACASDANRLQELDVISPERFDNAYFVDLRNRQGVLTSDQGLANDGRTSWLVNGFADNQGWFFGQFAASMEKMSKLSASSGGGEIRRNCFRRNSPGIIIQHGTDDIQASA